jgi:hypothetical protein
VPFKLAQALDVRTSERVDQELLKCVVAVSAGGRELGRLEENVFLEGTQRATLAALGEGHFIQPLPSATPTTYLKAISTPGEWIGQGSKLIYSASEVTASFPSRYISASAGPYTLEFAPPAGTTLAVSEYPNAKRYPFNGKSPGIAITGNSRANNETFGKFVVWELEIWDGKVEKLAIDFIQQSTQGGPPLYGMLRYHSTFE